MIDGVLIFFLTPALSEGKGARKRKNLTPALSEGEGARNGMC